MNELKRKNHYVPQMYLSRWGNNKKLFEYSLLVQHPNVPIWNHRAIKYIAMQRDLYIFADNGIENDIIEVIFDSRFENPAREPIDKLCKNNPLCTREWGIVTDFILAQFVRTPAYYLWVHEISRTAIPTLLDSISIKLQNKEYLNSPVNKRSLGIQFPMKVEIESSKYEPSEKQLKMSVVNGKGLWLHTIQQDLRIGSHIWSFFRSLNWSVVSSAKNILWPTCDNPVVACEMYGDILYRIQPSSGIQGKNKVFLFPISPQMALIGTQGKQLPTRMNASVILSKEIKLAIIHNALMYIYCDSNDMDIPLIRPRTVDYEQYNRIMEDFKQWHELYMNTEGNYSF